MRKDGFSNGKQAYSCGDCRRRYVPDGAYRRPGPAVKEQGIELYLEGNTLSGIGRMLGYSVPAVPGWVKKGDSKPWVVRGAERTGGLAGRGSVL